MNKFELMRRFVIGLFIWNLFLTVGIVADKYEASRENVTVIADLEPIPPYELEEVQND